MGQVVQVLYGNARSKRLINTGNWIYPENWRIQHLGNKIFKKTTLLELILEKQPLGNYIGKHICCWCLSLCYARHKMSQTKWKIITEYNSFESNRWIAKHMRTNLAFIGYTSVVGALRYVMLGTRRPKRNEKISTEQNSF